jgi:hypothetical protein
MVEYHGPLMLLLNSHRITPRKSRSGEYFRTKAKLATAAFSATFLAGLDLRPARSISVSISGGGFVVARWNGHHHRARTIIRVASAL